jgi:hypothetical protein
LIALRNAAQLALLVATLALLAHVALAVHAVRSGAEEQTDPVSEEIRATLRGTDQRSRSAIAQLDYASKWGSRRRKPTRRPVKTADGKAAEVVMFEVPSMSMPGHDFSIAFLLIDKRTVDWASCWTYNRTATQELLLEDVDGDGFLDLAFRAKNGFWGLQDERQHRRPGDARIWLAAYSINSKGLKPIFVNKDRSHHLKPWLHSGNLPVVLRVSGLPQSLPESEMCECTISATNTSKKAVELAPGWFIPEAIPSCGLLVAQVSDRAPEKIGPGGTITYRVVLHLTGDDERVTLQWSLSPH